MDACFFLRLSLGFRSILPRPEKNDENADEHKPYSKKLSDNFFDMNPGERSVVILEGDAKEFRVRSVWNLTHA